MHVQSFNSLHSTNATWDMQNCTDEKVGSCRPMAMNIVEPIPNIAGQGLGPACGKFVLM